MKLLVTGGAGFIGSNFIQYWLKTHNNDHVINFDKLTYAGNLANLTSVENDHRYSFIKGDVCDEALIYKIMKGVDVVVHFAAETHVDRSVMDPSVFARTNVLGTQTLLEAAKRHSISRFHLISTDEVFGDLPLHSQEKFTESTPYNPHSPYSASKAGADHMTRAYFDTFKLPITITNCANNFGPYIHPEKFMPLVITNLIEGKKVPIYGDGSYVRDWLYVEDHCRAIDCVLNKGKMGETYLVGSMHEDYSNLEIVRRICKLMGKDPDKEIEFVKDRPAHDRRYAIDWTKINKELGWEPMYPFEEALKLTVDWFVKNRQWWESIKKGEYTNYYKKQYDKK